VSIPILKAPFQAEEPQGDALPGILYVNRAFLLHIEILKEE